MQKDIQSIEDLLGKKKSRAQDDDQTAQGKFSQKQKQIKLKEIERLTEKYAAAIGLPYINLFGFPISPDALNLLGLEETDRLKSVCFFYDGANIRLGTVFPESLEVKEKLAELGKKYFSKVGLYVISESSFNYAFSLYKKLPKPREFVRGVEIAEEDLQKYSDKFATFKKLQLQVDEAPLSDIITVMMAAAIKSDASDIHIEGEEDYIKVRFRIDGILMDVFNLNKDLWKKIISRLKVLARVKINIDDKPQDGRTSIYLKDGRVDIRVSFLPTNFGESVVMRLLKSSSVGLEFSELGIRQRSFEQLKREVERPNGMIITTGPTGSGKTTTLYAILKKLNTSDSKIITIEDPIEYQLEGVNQSQTSEKYTFAHGLRSIVRQDPDVIMVGEIRDLETAEIAIQAALTGHMVLSTIHTNDAAGTVPRFLSMGVKSFLLSPALNAIIGQRLVRKICQHCKEEIDLDSIVRKKTIDLICGLSEEDRANIDIENLKFYSGKGCEFCQGIGYKGRIGIYEILTMNSEIEKMILTGNVSEYDMRAIAMKSGMITMAQDGVLKALDGITSLEEVYRVAE